MFYLSVKNCCLMKLYLVHLVEHLDKASTAYCMEISSEIRLMTNNTSGINTDESGQKLEKVTSFEVPGLSCNW